MTPVDYSILALLIISAGFGFVRGFFREIVIVGSWIAGLWLAARGTGFIEPYIMQWFADPTARKLVSTVVVVALVVTLGSLVGMLLQKFVQGSIFMPVDRMLGVFFGFLRGAVILGFVVLLALQFGLGQQDFWRRGKLTPMAETCATTLDQFIDLHALLQDANFLAAPKAVEQES